MGQCVGGAARLARFGGTGVSTAERLAAVLEDEGLFALAARARAFAFDDYKSDSATPELDLYHALMTADRPDLAARVVAGEWDATREESDEWARSPEGQQTMRDLMGGR